MALDKRENQQQALIQFLFKPHNFFQRMDNCNILALKV